MGGFRKLGRRGTVVGAAYLLTAATTVIVIVVLRSVTSESVLRQVLGAQFIAVLAAGLEPATTRALALSRRDEPLASSMGAILWASGIKALLLSPILALVWRIADPQVTLGALANTPLLCLVGFAVTDVRGVLDFEGRHASAIWLKQGGLAGGLMVLATLTAFGVSPGLALLAASTTRAALLTVWLRRREAWDLPGSWPQALVLLRDRRWIELGAVSLIAASGGSADRVFGLRYLSPQSWSAYFLLYEVFTKFWFVPYVLSPILFARSAGGRDGGVEPRAAWIFTAVAGAIFVATVCAVTLLAPTLATSALLVSAGSFPPLAVIAFAAAIALNSLVQLRVTELQAGGESRKALLATGGSALISTALFYLAIREGGISGLLYAWLVKSVVEWALVSLAAHRRLPSAPDLRKRGG